MGPRHVHLLEDVERLGSIRAACVEVGLSYRTCMNRLRRMEAVPSSRRAPAGCCACIASGAPT